MDDFVERVSDWVEETLERHGAGKVLVAPLTGLGLLVAVGFFAGPEAARYGGLLLLVVILSLAVLALLADRRARKKMNFQRSRILNRYANAALATQRGNPDLFQIVEWKEEVSVSRGGDASIVRKIRLRNGAAPLDVFWSGSYVPVERNIRDKDKRRVRVHATQIDIKGNPTVPFDTTHVWEESNRITAFVHLDSPIPPDGEFTVTFNWWWPGHYRELVSGEDSDVVEFMFRHAVEKVSLSAAFAANCGVKELTAEPFSGSPSPEVTRHADGSLALTWDADRPPVGVRVGFRLANRRA